MKTKTLDVIFFRWQFFKRVGAVISELHEDTLYSCVKFECLNEYLKNKSK